MDEALRAFYELDEALAARSPDALVRNEDISAFNGAVVVAARRLRGFEGLTLAHFPPTVRDLRDEVRIAVDHLRAAQALRAGRPLPHGWHGYAPMPRD